METKRMKLLDICDIERVKKDKLYKAGTILIQVSATKDGNIQLLEEDIEAETKFVAVTATKDIDSLYLYEVIKMEFPRFLHKYKSGINLQMETFKYFTLQIHDRKEQKEIAEVLRSINDLMGMEIEMIEVWKDIKENNLDSMFC